MSLHTLMSKNNIMNYDQYRPYDSQTHRKLSIVKRFIIQLVWWVPADQIPVYFCHGVTAQFCLLRADKLTGSARPLDPLSP